MVSTRPTSYLKFDNKKGYSVAFTVEVVGPIWGFENRNVKIIIS